MVATALDLCTCIASSVYSASKVLAPVYSLKEFALFNSLFVNLPKHTASLSPISAHIQQSDS